MLQKSLAVYIGRFQPFHNGHLEVIKQAYKKHKYVLIFIGSADSARTIKNPFTFDERKKMINDAMLQSQDFSGDNLIYYVPLSDNPYNDQEWCKDVMNGVSLIVDNLNDGISIKDVYLTGANRDWTTYYLDMFPTFKKDFIIDKKDGSLELNATEIRNEFFSGNSLLGSVNKLPNTTLSFLGNFYNTEHFKNLKEEFKYIIEYKDSWKNCPYLPTFLTADSVVIQSGHVLLIQRKTYPGKNLWAVPGGFVNQNEVLYEAAIRELKEETQLKVPIPVLKGSFKFKEVFDKPDRSLRGRTITVAHLFVLADGYELPKIYGSDDAATAKWVPLSWVDNNRNKFFEDHYHMITSLVSKIHS